MNFPNLGQSLVLFGMVLTVVGLFVQFGGDVPFLGKLPGDIYVNQEHFKFYFPVTSSIIVSIILSIIIRFFKK